MVILGPLILLGPHDITQKSHSILEISCVGTHAFFIGRNSSGNVSVFCGIDTSGRPFSREQRSVVYARSKNARDTIPFGTVENVYETGYEWVNHL
ncbi:MAG: hypothetical protein Ct9H300mP21_07400 [Pseudomonadota bacterium]|nr:MAG: hypothetical protein Ct9H300mP21_07400 [Pseudomonadota bacterium]